MKTIDDYEFKNKTVIIRIDINAAVIKGKIQDSERFKQASKTIKELKNKKAKIIILAHQSRPGKKDFTNLKQHAKILNKYTKITYINDILGKKAINEIKKLKPGKAILLENIRTLKEEMKPGKNKIVKTLKPLVDYYVNDAFSICHRKQTSITSLPKYIPACAGRTLEKEINQLKQLNKKNALYILGGAKPEEVIPLMKNKVMLTGMVSQIFWEAKGKDFGAQSVYLKSQGYKPNKKLKKYLKKTVLPEDYELENHTNLTIKKFPSEKMALDIGKNSIKKIKAEIKKAKTIFMKGPTGMYEKGFTGTKEILKAMEKSKAKTIIGGGHTITALKKYKIKNIDHISLSGGALLQYLAGKKLPGIKALN